ncbi:LPXTG cell wall anchor domain-containing protein [Cellulomonas sp. S1-8]|uniref:LPXTG cell wall anchor domain-containing protein n=1 Tax=Cellulomonas sp. S1-8 TaxID=2904790 RepID=UPI0022444B95|nr:LPXTG cell wall anchor domain-containing protein [Cellulomonas sp. S1-8]UZN03436.1 LPXTG cell wall anchor domain-containing protein [Cellulomonas sp. S1-8]
MNRRTPLILLSVAALTVLPAATATAGGNHGSGKPGHSAGSDRGKPDKGRPTPALSGDLCGGKRAGAVIGWNDYTCEQATGYFLYEKLDASKSASFSNSGPQHRVALHDVWAWPTADRSARHGASRALPKNPQIIPLELDDADVAAVCAEPDAYGLQVDLIGDGIAGRGLDVPSIMPTAITPPDGGFPTDFTLAFYGHYDVSGLVDVDALCAEDEVLPTPTPEPTVTSTPTPTPEPTVTPTPTPEPSESPTPSPSPEPSESPTPTPTESSTPTPTPSPTAEVDDEPEATPTPTPSPSPSETSEVLPAPADTPTPTASSTPAPSPAPSSAPSPTATERAEVLAAVEDDNTLAATGTQAVMGLLAAIAAIAGGAALVLARRRHRTDS